MPLPVGTKFWRCRYHLAFFPIFGGQDRHLYRDFLLLGLLKTKQQHRPSVEKDLKPRKSQKVCSKDADSVNFARHGYGHCTVACAYLAGMPGCRPMSRFRTIQNTCQYILGYLLILTIRASSHSRSTCTYRFEKKRRVLLRLVRASFR